MVVLKYLSVLIGIALFGSSGALLVYDISLSSQLRRLLGRRRDKTTGELLPEDPVEFSHPLAPVRWGLAQRLAAAGGLPLFVAFSISITPDRFAGVRSSQIQGRRTCTLYPCLELGAP